MEVLAKAAAGLWSPGSASASAARRSRRGSCPSWRTSADRGGLPAHRRPRVGPPRRGRGAEPVPRRVGARPGRLLRQAHSVGLGHELELLALRRAAEAPREVTGYVAMNVSPATLLLPETQRLRPLPLDRVLLELSEHDRVEDYTRSRSVLEPLRRRGMRLAIDDVGAGFSSLRHIVLTTLMSSSSTGRSSTVSPPTPCLTTLVRSLVVFAHGARRPRRGRGHRDRRGRRGLGTSTWTTARAGTSVARVARRTSRPTSRRWARRPCRRQHLRSVLWSAPEHSSAALLTEPQARVRTSDGAITMTGSAGSSHRITRSRSALLTDTQPAVAPGPFTCRKMPPPLLVSGWVLVGAAGCSRSRSRARTACRTTRGARPTTSGHRRGRAPANGCTSRAIGS